MSEQTTQAAVDEIWRLFKETDIRFKETDIRFKETDARLEKTFQETEQQLRRLEAMFGSQWGKLLEALVCPDALRLFQERGIRVQRSYRRSESKVNGRTMEIDLILEDDAEIVLVEVKSRLKVEDVVDFLDDLDQFTNFFPKFKGYRIYGAVAGLDIEEDADHYAYKRGLFVLGVVGEGIVQILNDMAFRPRNFGAGASQTAQHP